jgi:DNA invertase Pin-like site-specific DNA recombinase
VRLLIYTRSSAQNGDSHQHQEQVCREWANENGHDVVGVFSDDGVSGTRDAESRPGLSAALTELEEGKADGLLLHRPERMARALHIQEAILAHVWNLGGNVFCADGGEIQKDDPTDPIRTFVRQIMGAAGQLERGLVIARLQAGKRRQRETGYYSGGKRTYGYQVLEGGKLEPIKSEQAIIREIVELRKSETLRSVAATLNARNVLAPSGGKWQAKQIQRIEKREN